MIIHIDCNSFFSSCEVSIRPELRGLPVVVGSSTDRNGIILALSPEAKALGLKRGDPFFRVDALLRRAGVHCFEADHHLYADVSRRLMQAVRQQGIVLDFVQYSIDEFFGRVPLENPAEVRFYMNKVKDEIWAQTSIPVSCGCSQTYTLAKVATWYAKHYGGYDGVCVLTPEKREQALARFPIEAVWGIGRKYQERTRRLGLRMACDFAALPEREVQAQFSTAGLHTWQELHGMPAVELHDHSRGKQSIMYSRTFKEMTPDLKPLVARLSNYVASAATELRAQQSLCRTVTVFLGTNRFRDDLLQRHVHDAERLPKPTSDTPELVKCATQVLQRLYARGYLYKRMGVVLGGISDEQAEQPELFEDATRKRRRRVMQVADTINGRIGRGTLKIASQVLPVTPSDERDDTPDNLIEEDFM